MSDIDRNRMPSDPADYPFVIQQPVLHPVAQAYRVLESVSVTTGDNGQPVLPPVAQAHPVLEVVPTATALPACSDIVRNRVPSGVQCSTGPWGVQCSTGPQGQIGLGVQGASRPQRVQGSWDPTVPADYPFFMQQPVFHPVALAHHALDAVINELSNF